MPARRQWEAPRITRSSAPDFIQKTARKRDVKKLLAVRDLVQQALDLIEGSEAAKENEPRLRAILAEIDAEIMNARTPPI